MILVEIINIIIQDHLQPYSVEPLSDKVFDVKLFCKMELILLLNRES